MKKLYPLLFISVLIYWGCEDESFSEDLPYFVFGGNGGQVGYSVIQVQDGGYVITGLTDSENDDGDVLVLKLNQSGSIEWNQSLGDEHSNSGYEIRETTDGDYVIIGTDYNDISNDNVTSDIVVYKIDSEGILIWKKSYGNNHDNGRDLKVSFDGGLILLGRTETQGQCCEDIVVIKTNSNGNEEWSQTYDFNGSGDIGITIDNTSDGGYLIGGHTSSGGEYEMLVFKIDSQGNKVWENHDFGYFGNITSVREHYDGGYVILGIIRKSSGNDLMLSKINVNGEIVWSRIFEGVPSIIGESLEVTDDNGFIITGEISDGSNNGVLVLKTDLDGTKIWSKSIGTNNYEQGHSVIQNNDGGYVITGRNWTEDNYDELIVIFIDSEGNTEPYGD
jgi:hypothetical protein